MIIDHLYEAIVQKLTYQGKIVKVSKDLLSLQKNYERVLLVYDIIDELNTFPKLEQVEKCAYLSTQYRNQGNQSYQKKDFYIAWQYYNLSLLYAPLSSENYYLSISNRSAVFFELKKYKECLKDVEFVLTYEIPPVLKQKLNNRQELCLINLQKNVKLEKGINDEIKLKVIGDRDKIYTCASSKLEVKYSNEMGRHVIAKEDIKVGEVLADEKPYLSLIIYTQLLFSCSYCLSRVLNLVPCDNCCFALYCSNECKMQSFKEYHEIECPLMATLIKMDFTKLELLALRIAIKCRNDHETWNNLFVTIKEAESNIGSEFHGQVKVNDKWVYDSKYYTSIHTLETNVEKRSVSDIFQKSVTAAVFLKFLSEYTKFMIPIESEDAEEIRQCVAGTLLLHIMTAPTNMHGISTNIENKEGKYSEEISLASAVYAFLSLLNHSCAPNVVRFTTLGQSNGKLIAIRPIKKGMQIFDNYGSHHAVEDYPSRITNLKFQYKFICHCEACTNKWPTYLDMISSFPCNMLPKNIKTSKDKILSCNNISLLERGDKKTAIKLFYNLCKLCEDLEPFIPCKDICDSQEALKQCLMILEGTLPFGCCQTVLYLKQYN